MAVDGVFQLFGVADGVVLIDLGAAEEQPAARIHLDDGAGPFQRPLDAPAGQRPTFRIDDGGDEDVFGAERQNEVGGPHLDARGPRVEGGESVDGAGGGAGALSAAGGAEAVRVTPAQPARQAASSAKVRRRPRSAIRTHTPGRGPRERG